jgi:hypothetical protein
MAVNQKFKLAETTVPHGLKFERVDDTNEPFAHSILVGRCDLN